MTRAERVIVLLGSLPDVLPAADTWTGNLVARSALRGPGPQHKRSCSTCQGRRLVRDRFGRDSACSMCGGKGHVYFDGYVQGRVGTPGTSLVRHTSTVRCDSCWGEGRYGNGHPCTYCRGSGRRTVTPRERDTSMAASASRDNLDLWGQGGSYHELLRALEGLHVYDVLGHRLTWRVHAHHVLAERELSVFHRLVLRCALDYVEGRMPEPILVPAGAAHAARRLARHGTGPRGRWANGHTLKERDGQIRRWAAEGKPGQWIAQQVGLTPARVCQITKKETNA